MEKRPRGNAFRSIRNFVSFRPVKVLKAFQAVGGQPANNYRNNTQNEHAVYFKNYRFFHANPVSQTPNAIRLFLSRY